MRKKIIDYVISMTPRYWLMNETFNKEWDSKINYLIDNYKFTKINNGYTAVIGGAEIWVENHPYASFTLDTKLGKVRPSRSTIAKAGRIYRKYLNEQKKVEIKIAIEQLS